VVRRSSATNCSCLGLRRFVRSRHNNVFHDLFGYIIAPNQMNMIAVNEKMPKVDIVSVTWNDRQRLPLFIANLKKLVYKNYQFIMIDNNSSDETVSYARRKLANSIIIQNSENRGTTGGYNVGYRYALRHGCNYIWNLAIDVIVDPHCLDELVEVAESDQSIGIAGPIVYYSHDKNRIESYGTSFEIRRCMKRENLRGILDPVPKLPVMDVGYVDGGTAIIRHRVFQVVGLMDDKLFMYCEDSDFCVRAQRAGFRTVVAAGAKVWHRHDELRGRMPTRFSLFYATRNQFYLVKKHCSKKDWLLTILGNLWGTPRNTWRILAHMRFDLFLAYCLAIVYGMLGLMGRRLYVRR
jgi:GT2 family glycosyltransferase